MTKQIVLALGLLLFASPAAHAAMRVDIYGPGQNIVNLALAAPIRSPQSEATAMGRNLQQLVEQNLSFLPFMRLTSPKSVLGGTVLMGYEPPNLDFKRFQLSGSDILVTTFWPDGDSGTKSVHLRAFETNTGVRLFGREYLKVSARDLPEVADRFCADLLEALTGNGAFFRSTLAFIKKTGKLSANVWLVKPTGRDLRQITNMQGEALSPAWSPDGRFVVFSHIDTKSHALGVWDSNNKKVQRIRFPGNVVIGPAFMPDNKVAVALSNGKYPVIFLLNHVFQKERVLEQSDSINVSPTFDSTGTKMAFTSSRMGGPQIFLKDLNSGVVVRVSKNGTYNTESNLSHDGTLVVYSRMTDYGHRIFVQDMVTGMERQVTFGPGSDEQPAFCADSYFIAFASTRGGGGIYLTTRHGGDAKQVPTGGGPSSFPRWSVPSK
ncbi:PD40 domain-containing protein [Candidatus Desulfovibrio trichonymphae]|uniref:Tol-Pal system periplasmic component TolB n=1 Tax=Candidatus Desulfovibrio trichonymphae TaxID=1725232 RepID=A0A1J1DRS7_9BACT|nr:PD40 domain-containing protein [Candidatus Desulfovibrio trichonymphae]BAV92567.1 Tol-Pal system periplasmic component TolB [Candidatus Desulfovibrio trichonymphae]GHU93131.1 protein TolB [Deltaproteobacteria bacterium]GHV00265.1 protein TolB [Deltaproteobacteria bacterium]